MTTGLNVTIVDGVAEGVLQRPAGGLWLDAAQRALILQLIEAPPAGLCAVLLRSAEQAFFGHADGGPDVPLADDSAAPSLRRLCEAVAASAVPVVLLLDGPVTGAMAELALAAQARLASPGARIGFGAARLGRISDAGSTQRLPHLVGAEQALRLLIEARSIPAPEALAIGLLDRVFDLSPGPDLCRAALAWARSDLAGLVRRSALSDGRSALRAVSEARARAVAGSVASALVDCVEAALLLPPAQGHAYEAVRASERASLPETAALVHLLEAERAAQRLPEALHMVRPEPVARPALVGASPVMAALALMMLARGLPVTILEPDRARLVPMLQIIAARQETAVQAGALSAAQRDADWARLRPVSDPAALAQADLLIIGPDAAPPSPRGQVPRLVMGRAALTDGAARLVVSGRIAELGLPQPFPAQTAATLFGFLRRIGQIVVLTGAQSPLGISGRLAGAGGAALRSLMAMGVAPQDLRAALLGFGLASPAVPTAEHAAPAPRDMPADEIVQRWLGALANEGARLLASGLARSAGDIDLVAVHGLGLPAASGGPLHMADQRGVMILRRDLKRWGEEAEVWQPVPALDALVSVGRGFAASIRRE